jgi:hypothetical protein
MPADVDPPTGEIMSKNTLIILAALGAIATLILIFTFLKPPATGLPAASNLTAVNQPNATTPSVKLDWHDNSTNETGFKVLRKPSGDTAAIFTLITTTAANITTYTDAGLTNYWEYDYEVIATNAVGDAPPSNIVKTQALLATTPTNPPTGGKSVKDYGATGDGNTDDKGAIQNAFNGCTSGGSVLFPAGTYKVSGTLSLKAACSYYGEGAPILRGYTGTGAGGYSIAKTAGSDIDIVGLTFDGGGIDLSVEMQKGIQISGCKFQNILNSNTSFGAAWAGIWIGGTLLDSSIDHNTFTNILDGGNANVTDGQLGGIRGYRLSRVHIVDNTFDRLQQGISISQSQAAEETLASYDDVQISRNKFTQLRRMALEIQAHKLRRWVIEDNVGSNWLGTMFWNSFGISHAADGWDGVIRHNIFTANSGGAGYCIELGGGQNMLAEANECRSSGKHWKTGITVAYAPNAHIKNNLLCGGFALEAIGYEPPHVESSGGAAILENNQTPATCP